MVSLRVQVPTSNTTRYTRYRLFSAFGIVLPTVAAKQLGATQLSSPWVKPDIILPTWKVNAFTCFAASSWGERIVEVDACCVQLVFGNHDFDHWYFYLRFCKFGIYLLCQYHGEFDRIGFCHFEIWRCGCVEMMRGIGGEGFFFSILGYRRGIARVSPEIRELYCLVLPCFVLSLLLLLLLVLLFLLLLLLLLTFPLPSCVRHKGHTQQSSLAGRSGWQQPCVLEANGQHSPCQAWVQGDALIRLLGTCQSWLSVCSDCIILHLSLHPLVGSFALTVVVVKLASHCVFQQNHSK